MIWIWKTLWDSAKNTRAHVRQPQSVLPNFYLRKAAVLRKLVENEQGSWTNRSSEWIQLGNHQRNFWIIFDVSCQCLVMARHLRDVEWTSILSKKSGHSPGLNCYKRHLLSNVPLLDICPGKNQKWHRNKKLGEGPPIIHMDVSENGGTPKSSILIGFSIINHPFWGTRIFGNIHITNG